MNRGIRTSLLVFLLLTCGAVSGAIGGKQSKKCENNNMCQEKVATRVRLSAGLLEATGPMGSPLGKLCRFSLEGSVIYTASSGVSAEIGVSSFMGNSSEKPILPGAGDTPPAANGLPGADLIGGSFSAIAVYNYGVEFKGFGVGHKSTGTTKAAGTTVPAASTPLEFFLKPGAKCSVVLWDLRNRAAVIDGTNNSRILTYFPGVYLVQGLIGLCFNMTAVTSMFEIGVTSSLAVNIWNKEGSSVVYSYNTGTNKLVTNDNPPARITSFGLRPVAELELYFKYLMEEKSLGIFVKAGMHSIKTSTTGGATSGALSIAYARAPSLAYTDFGVIGGFVIK